MVLENTRERGVIVTVRGEVPDADQIKGHYKMLLEAGQGVDPQYLRHITGGVFEVTEKGMTRARQQNLDRYVGKGEAAFGD